MKARSPLQRVTTGRYTVVNSGGNWEGDRQHCQETIKICIFKQFVICVLPFCGCISKYWFWIPKRSDTCPLENRIKSRNSFDRKYWTENTTQNEFHLILNEFEYSFVCLKFGTRKVASTESPEQIPSIPVELLLTFLWSQICYEECMINSVCAVFRAQIRFAE